MENIKKPKNIRKMEIEICVKMGFTVSFIMSLTGSLIGNLSSGHFKVLAWLMSFAASFALSALMAILIGFFIPMKKINERLEKKHNLKEGTFKKLIVQSFVSDILYTPIISIAVTFLMVFAFAIPAQQRVVQAELQAQNRAFEQMNVKQEELEHESLRDESKEMDEKVEQMVMLTDRLADIKDASSIKKMLVRSWLISFPIEFVIALIVIMVVEPRIQAKAFKKYFQVKSE